MANTRELLEKITALRQRLDQAQGLAQAAGSVAAAIEKHVAHTPQGPHFRDRDCPMNDTLLDRTLRQLPDAVSPAEEQVVFPSKLTARGFRLVKHGRETLDQLRALGESPHVAGDLESPLAIFYRHSVAMIDTVLRMVQAFPEAPSAQYRLCEGLEAILENIDQRLVSLKSALAQRHDGDARTHTLANLLIALVQGKPQSLQDYRPLAQTVLEEAAGDGPLCFLGTPTDRPALFAAAHSLNVAQVVARLVLHDPQWQERKEQAVFAALLHDVGMIKVPAEILNCAGPLDDDQRRLLESHTYDGGEWIRRLADSDSWLVETAAAHHERVDGTGYPAGLLGNQFASLVQLLSVCDVYAAMCVERPYRPALETRTALTDTLLLAEQGALNRFEAEKLLQIGFYPVGSVVELADGAIGMVMSGTCARKPADPARPTLTLFFERDATPLTGPRLLDLSKDSSRNIVRTVPPAERSRLFRNFFPMLV